MILIITLYDPLNVIKILLYTSALKPSCSSDQWAVNPFWVDGVLLNTDGNIEFPILIW